MCVSNPTLMKSREMEQLILTLDPRSNNLSYCVMLDSDIEVAFLVDSSSLQQSRHKALIISLFSVGRL